MSDELREINFRMRNQSEYIHSLEVQVKDLRDMVKELQKILGNTVIKTGPLHGTIPLIFFVPSDIPKKLDSQLFPVFYRISAKEEE